jgi:hypothetical protein
MKLKYTVELPKKEEKKETVSPQTTMSMQQVVNQSLASRMPTGNGAQQMPQTTTSKGYGRTQ